MTKRCSGKSATADVPLTPAAMEALHNGMRAGMRGDDRAAVQFFRRAAAAAPKSPEIQFNLGTALKKSGEIGEALGHLEQAVRLAPDFAQARVNLGNMLVAMGRYRDAVVHLARAARIAPKANTQISLATAHLGERRLEEAERALLAALELDPQSAHAWNTLGTVVLRQGDAAKAVEHFRRALAAQPDLAVAHTNLVQALCFVAASSPESVLEAARDFDRICARPLLPASVPLRSDARGRRLRIGYCSADLYTHPVGFFWAPVIASHDRERFEVFVYDDGTRSDHITDSVKANADHWSFTRYLDDAALAGKVRADGIDVLIDLAGHSSRNRLLALARRPAPLQGVAGGHFSTTGMAAMDFLVADPWHVPLGMEAGFAESILRLPHGYVCYQPPAYAAEVGPLPAAATGMVTFGAFNRLAKVGDDTVRAWARVLDKVRNSRLLLIGLGLEGGKAREQILQRFRPHGIGEDRLVIEGEKSHVALLAAYNRVDIALDTFPYSGGLTTCEALWMGIPVVALQGALFSSRHSLSHLSNVGLGQLAAANMEDYVAIAASLATDLPQLAQLRAELRARVATSPLCDVQRHTRAFEAALLERWGES